MADDVVQTMVERITKQFRPLRIVLFGSRARGQATASSDVDLLVVLPEVANKRHATVEVLRALGDLPVAADVVVTTPEELARRGQVNGDVLRAALREGKVVYECA
jgi:predicted nucleotidyltransferase